MMTDTVVSTAGPSTVSLSPTTTPTGPDVTTSAPNSQLSLIIGLPVGIGLAMLGLGACFIWLTCSAYCENKDNPRGTASSNLVSKMHNFSSDAAMMIVHCASKKKPILMPMP